MSTYAVFVALGAFVIVLIYGLAIMWLVIAPLMHWVWINSSRWYDKVRARWIARRRDTGNSD